MVYAYVVNGTVTLVERRTDTAPYLDDPLAIIYFYAGPLVPFFKPVPEEIKDQVRPGWIYTEDKGFHQPEPFEINPDSGEMYLPASIDAEAFYAAVTEASQQKEQTAALQSETADLSILLLDTDFRLLMLENGMSDIL